MIVRELETGKSAILDTPAKINLFLEVLYKRPDGYHEINSLFQAVSLFDTLKFEVLPHPGITLHIISNDPLPVNEDNLVARTYQLVQKEFGLKKGLSVQLTKRIPVSAGLGGGSSDAAATILACNLLFELRLSYDNMASLGADIGSDVPFFFSGGQALVSGRGEVVLETSYPVDYQLIMVKPSVRFSTAESYAALRMGLTKSKPAFKLQYNGMVEDFLANLRFTDNDFEKVHVKQFPELSQIKELLLTQGAIIARMSGSGPTIYGIFINLSDRKEKNLKGRGDWRLFTVKPIALSKQVIK